MMRPVALIAATLGLAALAGCGIKAPPLPPVITVAETTRDLEVFQDDRQAVLSWSYPSSTTAGEQLTDLESVEVWRATLAAVEAPPPGESSRDRDLNRQLLMSNGELIADLDRAGLDAATRGAKLEFRDDLDRWRAAQTAKTDRVIWYAVRTVCCNKRESRLSNIARLSPSTPPPPPTGLELEPEPAGIRLTWVPSDSLPVLIERSPSGDAWQTVTRQPLTTGEWLDRGASQNRGWNYRLRSVLTAEGHPRVVGEPTPALGIFYPDIYPPDAPTDLVCLPEETRVRIRWRSDTGEVQYRIYRGGLGEDPELLVADHTSSQYEDLTPPPGTSIYRVTAVDAAGNESSPSTCTAARGGKR
jgi:hypothetical protein